ncbi:MAG: type II toxin-antitoxin system PemK/MazF family toxin [Defluviicoccus sp.]|nr:type II toxin-antitoxin system PemK/MazF family toxin [Defluviicoccus sp.]MDE0382940.1 type II toxin-antitoxin system PemK/MazF family toxin [Defluviicoccus sp.]
MKRGELWIAAGGGDYTSKPRPVVVLQDDRFGGSNWVTVCTLTSDGMEAPLLRIPVLPTPENGLHAACSVMVDRITALRRGRLTRRIGALSLLDMRRIERSLLVFLGIAG